MTFYNNNKKIKIPVSFIKKSRLFDIAGEFVKNKNEKLNFDYYNKNIINKIGKCKGSIYKINKRGNYKLKKQFQKMDENDFYRIIDYYQISSLYMDAEIFKHIGNKKYNIHMENSAMFILMTLQNFGEYFVIDNVFEIGKTKFCTFPSLDGATVGIYIYENVMEEAEKRRVKFLSNTNKSIKKLKSKIEKYERYIHKGREPEFYNRKIGQCMFLMKFIEKKMK